MMRERFAKLLLGEDMSGSGKGVCTAVTVSNSITNLYGSFVFLISLFIFFVSFALFSKTEYLIMGIVLQRLCLDRV